MTQVTVQSGIASLDGAEFEDQQAIKKLIWDMDYPWDDDEYVLDLPKFERVEQYFYHPDKEWLDVPAWYRDDPPQEDWKYRTIIRFVPEPIVERCNMVNGLPAHERENGTNVIADLQDIEAARTKFPGQILINGILYVKSVPQEDQEKLFWELIKILLKHETSSAYKDTVDDWKSQFLIARRPKS